MTKTILSHLGQETSTDNIWEYDMWNIATNFKELYQSMEFSSVFLASASATDNSLTCSFQEHLFKIFTTQTCRLVLVLHAHILSIFSLPCKSVKIDFY